jgi:glycosyltransferase involved in cell wall biosynthesis
MATRNPKISLYLIAGHEAQFIDRCLKAFQPVCSEIVVCMAQGGRPDDGTRAIAEKSGAKIVEYHNAPAAASWQHIDNFAAARNCALNACTGDYAFWADCDDLPHKDLKNALKRAVEAFEQNPKLGIYAGVYAVLNAKLTPVRERMVKRLEDGQWSGRWHYAVHEALLPLPGYESVGEQQVWVEHHPGGYKPNSADRNLRILQGQLSEAGKYAYYFQQELFLGNKRNESLPWSHVAAIWPGQEATLAYEAACNEATATQDRTVRIGLYHKAHQMNPGRREAIYFLAREEASVGAWLQAYHLLKSAMVQPDPGLKIWNAQRTVYDFECIDLYLAACRAVGDTTEADKIEKMWRSQKPVKISVCHATRGRPQEAINARILWMKKAADPASVEWIFSCDNNDPSSEPLKNWNLVKGEGGCVAAWNRAAAIARGEIIIQGSDDWDPPLHWDAIITERLGDTSKPAVLAISDGHRKDDLLCMAILTKARLAQQGTLFAPEYDACSGIFSDNEYSLRGAKDGVIIPAKDIVFTHNNPLFTGATQDAEFKRHNAKENYELGEKIFKERNP